MSAPKEPTCSPLNLPPEGAGVMSAFNRLVLGTGQRLLMPIAVYPGAELTGATVRDIVTNAEAQCQAVAALHERFATRVVMSAMDLSVEAEAFGATIRMTDTEIPTVIGRLITDPRRPDKLRMPRPGDARTAVPLETVRCLTRLPDHPLVLAGCIGPFSLASRLAGVSETLEMTLTAPDFVHRLLEPCAEFLTAYLEALNHAGAAGAIMAEPMAGLLSPAGLAEFSSAWIRPIAEDAGDGGFSIVLHNCGAQLQHLPGMLETGLESFHFGAPMDIRAALEEVPADVVLCGNLDPSHVFVRSSAAEVGARARELLEATKGHRNFVLSSGCDLPPGTPISSLEALFAAAR
jgi:uroporphyrinogen decarboxylase